MSRLRMTFSRQRLDDDLRAEVESHLQMEVDANVERGMTPQEAVHTARRRFGNMTTIRESSREAWMFRWIETAWQDVRYGVRLLRRSPGFAALVVLTLAFGIGANTAIFSVVNSLVLKALPVAEPERLAMLSSRSATENGYPAGWNYPMWEQLRRLPTFAGAAAWSAFPQRFDLARGGERDPVVGEFVSGGYFAVLGVRPLLGRTFTAADDVLGGPAAGPVSVISHGFWQRRFGGATDVVGRTIFVGQVPVTIVGVLPPEFFGVEVGRAFEIALPLGSAPLVLNDETWGTNAGRSYLGVIFRLHPEQRLETAEAMLRDQQRRIVEAAMPPEVRWGPYHEALLEDPFVLAPAAAGTSELRRQYVRPLVAVFVLAAIVLLIACANIASLVMTRAAVRQAELRVRTALGAPRHRLVQQLLMESVVLAALGAGAGLSLALWGSHALVSLLSTQLDQVVLDVSVDRRVAAFTAGLAVATTVLCGLAPALGSTRGARRDPVRDCARLIASGWMSGLGLRGGLVVAQVTLSLVLVVAAGLFIRTFEQVSNVALGFDGDRVLVVNVDASRAPVAPGGRLALYERLRHALATLPDAAHAAASLTTPVSRAVTLVTDVVVRGRPAPPLSERRVVANLVSAGWAETYGAAVRSGRAIDAQDTAGSPPVVLVNEEFVRRFLPGIDPVGETLVGGAPPPAMPMTPRAIVGVVGDAVDQTLRGGVFPTIYLPLSQWSSHWEFDAAPVPAEINIGVRVDSGSPARLAPGVAAALTSIEPTLTFSIRPLADLVSEARHQERVVAWLSGVFGVLALALAATGLYGVTAYAVARRRAEIGIRMALGARRHQVVGLALRQTILMMAVGTALGLGAAAAITRYLDALLFGIAPLDPVTFVAAPALLAAVAGLAALIPAGRAATVDPMQVIRCE